MSIDSTSVQPRDLTSVGTRISWGAIWAGSILALAIGLLMSTIAGAVGLSVQDRVSVTSLQWGSVIWALLTAGIALFVGGMLTSLLTVGENKTEAVVHGIIMWALVLGLLLFLGAIGVRSGIGLMSAGVSFRGDGSVAAPTIRLDSSRDTTGAPSKTGTEPGLTMEEMSAEQARRLGWYSFAAIWLSMLAAAAGAYAGAGPTFRVVGISSARTITARTTG